MHTYRIVGSPPLTPKSARCYLIDRPCETNRYQSRLTPGGTVIACPLCGADTTVAETRSVSNAARRRRACTDPACPGRVTTIELTVPKKRRRWDRPLSIVATSDLAAMHATLAAMIDPGEDEP